ncbi:unnamed protein product [Calypogeia fissa]
MDWGFKRFFCLFAVQALLFIHCAPPADATVGVVYGTEGDNLPLPSQVVSLLKNNFVSQVRIYDTDTGILNAFIGSSIQVTVGVKNSELLTVGASNASAASWLNTNVIPFATAVNITAIAVGDEVLTKEPSFSASLAQTMEWIQAALISHGLDKAIQVSTPFSTAYLQNSFPPSQATFNVSMLPYIKSILQVINSTGSYVMMNIDTFEVFQTNSASLTLQYALFQPESPVMDAYANLAYYSLFDALLDAGYAALTAAGYGQTSIVVSQTGWPSNGDSNENGANVTNAQAYNSNLVAHVNNGSEAGTPARPTTPITAYVYELFNEDLQTGPTSNRYYGLFQFNLTPAYNVDLTGHGRALTSNGTEYQTWCVANSAATPQDLQQALDWACGNGGVNCSATLVGGPCYLPNTLPSHASWVFNAYYQMVSNAPNSCYFNGAAEIVSYNPSYGTCVFQASNVTTTVPGTAIPPTSPNSARLVQLETGVLGGCLLFLFMLTYRHLRDLC